MRKRGSVHSRLSWNCSHGVSNTGGKLRHECDRGCCNWIYCEWFDCSHSFSSSWHNQDLYARWCRKETISQHASDCTFLLVFFLCSKMSHTHTHTHTHTTQARAIHAEYGTRGFFNGWFWRTSRMICAVFILSETKKRLAPVMFPKYFEDQYV